MLIGSVGGLPLWVARKLDLPLERGRCVAACLVSALASALVGVIAGELVERVSSG